METLIFNTKSKKDLNLLLDIAKKIGWDIRVAPKNGTTTKKVEKTRYNAETEKVIADAKKGIGLNHAKNSKELFKALGI